MLDPGPLIPDRKYLISHKKKDVVVDLKWKICHCSQQTKLLLICYFNNAMVAHDGDHFGLVCFVWDKHQI